MGHTKNLSEKGEKDYRWRGNSKTFYYICTIISKFFYYKTFYYKWFY